MSKPRYDTVAVAAVVDNVSCPTCKSEAGEQCVKMTRRGVRTVLPCYPHPDRVLAAITFGAIPMAEY